MVTAYMGLKGKLIFWEISDFNITKAELEEKLAKIDDFERFIPRNDYKTAFLRAVQILLKGADDDRFYKRIKKTETPTFMPVPIFVPSLDFKTDTEVVVTVDKKTGELAFSQDFPQKEELQRLYVEATKTLDSKQFRSIVINIVTQTCQGVRMRRNGGIYYVNSHHLPKLEILKSVFALFQDTCRLSEVPIFNNAETQEALEIAITDEITAEIDGLISELQDKQKKNELKPKFVENRMNGIETIINRVRTHEEDLRGKAAGLADRIKNVYKVLRNIDANSNVYDLAEILANL